ncbi:hypothetical protein XENORESO_008757 [Xenotaenia resolanae]|uniref:Uncharacterized protein n=1 Tax=Xenotaenia resolanae TaxID=208358 RepID=A0ABV0W7X8_9TELE
MLLHSFNSSSHESSSSLRPSFTLNATHWQRHIQTLCVSAGQGTGAKNRYRTSYHGKLKTRPVHQRDQPLIFCPPLTLQHGPEDQHHNF